MKTQIFILIAICMAICSSCENAGCNLKDRNLTKQTQNGANTMSCMIDGKVWVATGGWNKDNKNYKKYMDNCRLGSGFDDKTSHLIITGYTNNKCSRQNGSIDFDIDTSKYAVINGKRRYALISYFDAKTSSRTGSQAIYDVRLENYYFAFKPEHKGWVEIDRHDTLAGVLAGRFEFYARSENDTTRPFIHFSDGRFDINLKTKMECSNLR